MKTTTVLLPLLLAGASVHGVAVPDNDFSLVKGTPEGGVYSNVPAHIRRDNSEQFHQISTNEHGGVYSNVVPSTHQKRQDEPELSDDEAKKEIAENHLVDPSLPEDAPLKERSLEKRDWKTCARCVAACGLNRQGISLFTISQQVSFCLRNCFQRGLCTYGTSVTYQNKYGLTFPPPGQPA